MENFDISRIDGHSLRVFLNVLQSGSVTKTAEDFSINQSTVSHTLEKLRHAVGQVLFVRAGRGIAPTSAAIAFAPHAREVVMKLESLVYLEAFQAEVDDRPITIATNVTELLPELLELVEQLKINVPNAHVRLLELGSRDNIEVTLENEISDIVISAHSDIISPMLSTAAVTRDPLKIFYDGSMRSPIRTIDDYFEAEHATLDFGGTRKSTVTTLLDGKSRERKLAVGVANVYALAGIIKGSQYISTMQERLKFSVFSNLDFVDPPFESKGVGFDLIWHKRHQHDSRNTWLRELVKRVFKDIGDRLDVKKSY